MKRLSLLVLLFTLSLAAGAHPLHLSVTNIVLENGKLKVMIKTFPDDWETAYFHYHSQVVDFSLEEEREKPWFGNYLRRCFRLTVEEDGAPLALRTEQILYEEESMTITLSGELPENTNSLYIYQSLLTDIFPDQSNLVILKIGEEETGIKFDVNKQDEYVLLK
jgi:hypothetical protein